MEEWRTLLYPLGFLSAIPFTARFLLQWIVSETKRKSVVIKSFCGLSLAGNILLALHSLVQIQYHIFAVQICNGMISWRNLNLMQPCGKQFKLRSVIMSFFMIFSGATLLFTIQFLLFNEPLLLFRNPNFIETNNVHSLSWHIAGTIGVILFTSRFWIQWWRAERHKKSLLAAEFWILSLLGAIISVVYFFQIGDPVNAIGPAVGIIPYIRNLVLLKKSQTLVEQQ